MKLEALTLRGVLRFNEQVTLNLRDLPPGLIALVGGNGEGKSTTLESPFACLYRQWPSREHEILDYVSRADGFIEVTFELEGQGLYVARLNLDGPHRKAEGIIARLRPDGQRDILNDGKVTTYDATVRSLLPPPELLLASVFAAQNRAGSFAKLGRKERKELFSSLLGLDHYATLAERASTAAGLVLTHLGTLGATRDILLRDADDTGIEARAQQLQAEGGTLEVRRIELSREMEALEQELLTLADAAAAHKAALTRAEQIAAESHTRNIELARVIRARALFDDGHPGDRADLVERHRARLGDLGDQLEDTSHYTAEVAQIDKTLTAVLADADERIANNQQRIAQGPQIRAAVDAVKAIDLALVELRADQQRLHEEGRAHARREQVLLETLSAVARAGDELLRAEQDAAVTTDVPCGGAGEFASCQFLANAAAAARRIPALRDVLGTKPRTETDLASARDAIKRAAADLDKFRATAVQYEKDRAAKQKIAEGLPHLTAAEERIKAHQQRKVDAGTEAEQRRREAADRRDRRQSELEIRIVNQRQSDAEVLDGFDANVTTRRGEFSQQIAALDATIEALNAEAETVHATVEAHEHANVRYVEQSALLSLRRREWDDSTAALARVQTQRDELEARVRAIRARQAELAGVDRQITDLQRDLVEWQLLSKALGRDGLPVLEIDAAGPTVSAITNDLLQTCFGSARFSVDLITQEAKRKAGKDGESMKDSFEVKVFDAERGGDARDLSDLSGGEQILVDEALKSGIALLVNQRNVHPIRTCWRDETTGALDPENAQRYLAMLRRVHQLGGFWHTLFVTHNPDAALQADAQVVIDGGRIETRLPPYAQAA